MSKVSSNDKKFASYIKTFGHANCCELFALVQNLGSSRCEELLDLFSEDDVIIINAPTATRTGRPKNSIGGKSLTAQASVLIHAAMSDGNVHYVQDVLEPVMAELGCSKQTAYNAMRALADFESVGHGRVQLKVNENLRKLRAI